MTKAEINFRQLFAKATRSDLKAARLITNMAIKYFAPEDRDDDQVTEIIGQTEAAQRFGPKWPEQIAKLNDALRNRK